LSPASCPPSPITAENAGAFKIAKLEPLSKCFNRTCGQYFDSGPVDFLSRNGVRFLAPPESSSRTTQRVAAAAADALDAVLGDRFSVQRAELWAVLRRAEALPNKAPTLFVYSADDALAPLEVIETLAAALRDTGRPVTMQRWEHSGACGCARGAQTALLSKRLHVLTRFAGRAQSTWGICGVTRCSTSARCPAG
jgi:pimeloyl-ACP methyl ester carboxylesterase